MTKVLTWVRRRKYQWESRELEKACRITCYVALGMLVIFGVAAGVGDYLDLGQTFRAIIGISASGLICYTLGYASALQWADGKLKKSK